MLCRAQVEILHGDDLLFDELCHTRPHALGDVVDHRLVLGRELEEGIHNQRVPEKKGAGDDT